MEPSSCMIDIMCRCDTTWKNLLVWNHLLDLSILIISWTFAIIMTTMCRISLVSWSRHYLWILDGLLESRCHLKQFKLDIHLHCCLVLVLLALSWASNFDLTKLICLSFQVRFEPSLSFFTLIWRLSYRGCTCHLLAIQIKSSTWVH